MLNKKVYLAILGIVCINSAYAVSCNDLDDCLNRADDAYNNKDFSTSIAYNKVACNDYDSAPGCQNAASLLIGQKNYEDALYFANQACFLGNALGCSQTGFQYSNGLGTDKDIFKAAHYYHIGCDKRNATACENLGLLFANGVWFAVDVERGNYYFKFACDLGLTSSCDYMKKYSLE